MELKDNVKVIRKERTKDDKRRETVYLIELFKTIGFVFLLTIIADMLGVKEGAIAWIVLMVIFVGLEIWRIVNVTKLEEDRFDMEMNSEFEFQVIGDCIGYYWEEELQEFICVVMTEDMDTYEVHLSRGLQFYPVDKQVEVFVTASSKHVGVRLP